jgi:hypothetical protein
MTVGEPVFRGSAGQFHSVGVVELCGIAVSGAKQQQDGGLSTPTSVVPCGTTLRIMCRNGDSSRRASSANTPMFSDCFRSRCYGQATGIPTFETRLSRPDQPPIRSIRGLDPFVSPVYSAHTDAAAIG